MRCLPLKKGEWIKHFEARKQRPPTQDEINAWISDITPYHFDSLRQKAVDVFDTAARDYMRDEVEAAKEQALNSAIVREVKAAGVWWKQLLMALAMAILAPLILGAVIVFGDRFSHYPTPAEVARALAGQTPAGAPPAPEPRAPQAPAAP